jgi:hypothetical protein
MLFAANRRADMSRRKRGILLSFDTARDQDAVWASYTGSARRRANGRAIPMHDDASTAIMSGDGIGCLRETLAIGDRGRLKTAGQSAIEMFLARSTPRTAEVFTLLFGACSFRSVPLRSVVR